MKSMDEFIKSHKSHPIKLLLIEPDSEQYLRIKQYLIDDANGFYYFHQASSLEEGIRVLQEQSADLVLLNADLFEKSQYAVFKKAWKQKVIVPIILLINEYNQSYVYSMLEIGIQDCLLKKDLNTENLSKSIQHALWRYQFLSSLELKKKSLAKFISAIRRGRFNTLTGAKTSNKLYLLDEHSIREKELRIASLQHLAHYDPVTHLANRLAFDKAIQRALAIAKHYQRKFALLFIDIDKFKAINDTFGHEVGDLTLRAISDLLKENVRADDFIARLGGDEFAVIINEIRAEHEAGVIADQICKMLRNPIIVGEHNLQVSVSIGIACYPSSGLTQEELVKHADAAMYRAKKAGQNMYQIHQDTLHLAHQRQLMLERALPLAFERNELLLTYQPILQLETRQITGVEALVRWHCKMLDEEIFPNEIIPLAEKIGLIKELGKVILQKAIEDCLAWDKAGFSGYMSLNLSPLQLGENFSSHLQEQLEKNAIKAGRFHFELSEQAIIGLYENKKKLLKKLYEVGVKLSVDDFGSGHFSLKEISELPLNILKIDGSFVRGIGELRNEAAIRSIILLANAFGLRVVAKGIETKAQREFLIEHGCVEGQGFLFGKLFSAEQMKVIFSTDNSEHESVLLRLNSSL